MNIVSFIVSFLCGSLSALGVGGGSVLIIYLTQFLDVSSEDARVINLIAFIPTALVASYINNKNGLINKKAALLCAASGAVFAAIFAFVGAKTDPELIKKLFGGLLLFAGLRELFKKASPHR